jgi:uncharacterized membrane protein YkoI
MKQRWIWTAAAAAGMLVGCSNMHHEKEGEEGNEVKMTLDQVPPAVRSALQREAQGAAITAVDKEEDKGKTIYETDVMLNGKNWEIKVDQDGKLVSKKLDPENEKGEKGEKEEKAEKK